MVVVAGYLGAFVLLTLVLRAGVPVGVAYGIWGASGTAGTAVLAAALFGDPFTWPIVAGIGLIIAGVLLVEFGSHPAGRGRVDTVMWLALAGAILIEVIRDVVAARLGRVSARGSGSSRSSWDMPTSFYLLWVSLSLGMPVGIAYGVWTACGVALVAIIARFLFAEPLTWMMGAGIALIVAGVLTIEMAGAVY